MDSDPKKFFQQYCPELLTEEGQLKYFRTYDFSQKQTTFKQYWHLILNKYFQHYKRRAMARYQEIEDDFMIDGNRPLSLSFILLHLS